MNYDLNSLNEEQLKALKQINGSVLVTAGAGSGKTRLLTHRIAYLIKELGVSPYNILAITFTNKAAGEMKERVGKMVDGGDKIWISTFHSMCARLLRMEIDALFPYNKNFTIYSDADSERVIKEILNERGISDDKIKKKLLFHLSNWKNGNLRFEDYVSLHGQNEDELGSLMLAYENKLKKNNALDFDDLLIKTRELFIKNLDILHRYANRFEYILVDEFQDTNTVQYDLVKLLASVHGNVFVVGDEDQCIYSWRGANFHNIFNFKEDFSNTKTFKLEKNYRSTPQIIEVANRVIKNNKERFEKNMQTTKPSGEEVKVFSVYDEREEAEFVAKTIQKLEKEGYFYKDFAVLMRVNALSRSFEEAFLGKNIPHKIFGGFKFYERAEIKNVTSYLRLFVNIFDDVSFERVINFPKRGIGDGTIAKLRESGSGSLLENAINLSENSSLYKKIHPFVEVYYEIKSQKNVGISALLMQIIDKFGIKNAFNRADDEDATRLMNIDQLIKSASEFENMFPDGTIDDYLETITLASDNDEIGEGGAVTIATVHAVKGLEFKVVFLVGLEENIFPLQRAKDSESEMEEERRLMYVALTRAEERLFISFASRRFIYGGTQYELPSRFLKEIGIEEQENNSIRKQNENYFANSYNKKSYYEKKYSYDDYESDFSSKFEHTENVINPLFNKNLVISNEKTQKNMQKNGNLGNFKVGQKIFHPRFGEGILLKISDDGLVGDIDFESFGMKSLMLESPKIEIVEE